MLVAVFANPFPSAHRDVAVVQPNPVVAAHQDTSAQAPAPFQHARVAPTAPIDVQAQHDMAAASKTVKKMLHSKEYAAHLKQTMESPAAPTMAEAERTESVSTVTAGVSELPVSLEDLSESQLESVLQSLETEKTK